MIVRIHESQLLHMCTLTMKTFSVHWTPNLVFKVYHNTVTKIVSLAHFCKILSTVH